MIFNSIDFAVFLPIVFIIYWFACPNRKTQNMLLVVASYVFYGWWDWRFLGLIAFSSVLDFIIGQKIGAEQNESRRKRLLWLSLAVNLGFLGFFKYFNFFADSFVNVFTLFGTSFDINRLEIILPVGISFYTFQTLSYSIDVYRRKLKPAADPVAFFAFVSFFPQLVAGPIERASNLLPQFQGDRTFDYHEAVDGLRQMLFGLFKKVVIADNCAVIVNRIFENSGERPANALLMGAFLFAFQIYGDFSGYSDIAIGSSRLFGFKLKQNFAFPYFSRDIAEFWRRWHISLSSWFKDYLYIPLGGSRGGTSQQIRNTFIIFVVSGFWHGANWTFVVWGLINAIYFLPLLLTSRNRMNTDVVAQHRLLPSIRELFQIGLTFGLTIIAWVFFRADSLQQAWVYETRMIKGLILEPKNVILFIQTFIAEEIFIYLIILLTAEWISRRKKHALEGTFNLGSTYLKWMIYIGLTVLIFIQESKDISFIYFQF